VKGIRVSAHAKKQMILRGASEDEVCTAIHSGQWEQAKAGKFQAKYCFDFNANSPINQQFYKYKKVEPVFADEPYEIVVITVKVYYFNEKR